MREGEERGGEVRKGGGRSEGRRGEEKGYEGRKGREGEAKGGEEITNYKGDNSMVSRATNTA